MKRNEEYKDSGNEWIGEVPSHWNHGRLSYYSKIVTGGTPDKDNDSYWDNGTINWMSSGEVNKRFVYEIDNKITQEGYNNSNATLLPIDTVMVALNGQGKTKGTVAILKVQSTCNQSLAGFICNKEKLNPHYLYYYLSSKYKQIRGLVGDGQREGLNLSILAGFIVLLPSLQEQVSIVQYLDYQTSRIDQIIQQKELLLEKLQAKRQAIINEAVTKGLNPNVSMKPSGVKWLGDIPKNWEVKKLKYLCDLNSHTDLNPNNFKYKIALENIESKTGKYIVSDEEKAFEGDGNAFLNSDVLFSKLRPYLAKVFLPKNDGCAVGELLVLSPKTTITRKFLFYRLISPAFIDLVNSSTYGAKMPRANWNFISNIQIGVPSIEEQEEITYFLEKKIGQLDTLKALITNQIQKLYSYRQSLISEVVTGKIKVM